MPITRKQQVLAGVEASEGAGATLTGSDAIQVYDPNIGDSVDFLDRTPSGSTLSNAFQPPGRKTRELSFTTDMRGSGGSSEPDFGLLLKACGYRAVANIETMTCGTVAGGTGYFVLGERVSGGDGYSGVLVGITDSSGNPKDKAGTSGDILILARLGDAFSGPETVSGLSSNAATTVVSATDRSNAHGYQPTSEKLINIQLSGTLTGAAAGTVYTVKRSGETVGSVLCDTVNAGDDLDVVLLWGAIADADVITDGTNSETLDAAPVQTRTPSLAFWHNLDGRRRILNGARGTFTLQGAVGEPMQFGWTFQGDIGTDVDAAPATSSGLGTIRAPRLLGAVIVVGEYNLGGDALRQPIKSISLDNGGTVSPNLDANSAGGATGANIVDRATTITITIDNTLSAIDWEALRDAGTPVRFAAVLGTTASQMVAVTAPNCQVADVSLGDSEGISTFDVTLRPLRLTESGDDDLYFSQL